MATLRLAAPLARHAPGDPVLQGTVATGAAPGGRLGDAVERTLAQARCARANGHEEIRALVFDATGIRDYDGLDALQAFVGPGVRRLGASGRVIVLGTPLEACEDASEAGAQQAVEGLVRSLAMELRGGSTSQFVRVAPGGEDALDGTLRFLLSPRSAFMTGQAVELDAVPAPPPVDWQRPLDGRVALVTGAGRGIGAGIASALERDGAQVVRLDVPSAPADLELDVTEPAAADAIAGYLRDHHHGVDIVVHNAGISSGAKVAAMRPEQWQRVLDVNLAAPARITRALVEGERLLRRNGRVICMSSITGIGGIIGQANYAASKAGLIGFVKAMAPVLAEQGSTINAVAPGFITTKMTDDIPFLARELSRRMNSLRQGGRPRDVGEVVAWLASPGAAAINGRVIRVCGQSPLGA